MLPSYPDEILSVINHVRSYLQNHGWHTDIVVDFGSHAHNEARPDSDFDINLYVHHENLMYLFAEYAKRVRDPEDEVSSWHAKIKGHFANLRDTAENLEEDVQRQVERLAGSGLPPIYIVHIFDIRLVLLNLAYETWPVFELLCGRPMVPSLLYENMISALRSIRPFHRRFVDIHLDQCESTRMQAETGLRQITIDDAETGDRRQHWISWVVSYLRNLLLLRSVLFDGRFIADRKDILRYAQSAYPKECVLLDKLYKAKCDMGLHERYVTTGLVADLTADRLFRECEAFGADIRRDIRNYDAMQFEADNNEDNLFRSNYDQFRAYPFYASLV